MSTQSSLTIRFGREKEGHEDPDDEFDSPCAKNELGGGFDADRLDEDTGELADPTPEPSLQLRVASKFNGQVSGVSVSGDDRLTARLNLNIRTGAETTITFENACVALIPKLCWRPTPLKYPEWLVNEAEVRGKGFETGDDGLPLILITLDEEGKVTLPDDFEMAISWPTGNLNRFVDPGRGGYQALITWKPQGSEPPPIWCVGPLFGGDVKNPAYDDPFVDAFGGGIGIISEEDTYSYFGVRVPVEFVLEAEDGTESSLGEDAEFLDWKTAFQPRTNGGGTFLHSSDPETGEVSFSTAYTVTADSLEQGIAAGPQDPLPSEWTILMKVYKAYGRCNFSAHAFCDVVDAETGETAPEKQDLKQAAYFNRTRGSFMSNDPLVTIPVAKVGHLIDWAFIYVDCSGNEIEHGVDKQALEKSVWKGSAGLHIEYKPDPCRVTQDYRVYAVGQLIGSRGRYSVTAALSTGGPDGMAYISIRRMNGGAYLFGIGIEGNDIYCLSGGEWRICGSGRSHTATFAVENIEDTYIWVKPWSDTTMTLDLQFKRRNNDDADS